MSCSRAFRVVDYMITRFADMFQRDTPRKADPVVFFAFSDWGHLFPAQHPSRGSNLLHA